MSETNPETLRQLSESDTYYVGLDLWHQHRPVPRAEIIRTLLAQPETPGRVLSRLAWMRLHGSSLSLSWGEDTDLWECSWITGGKRYTGVSSYLQGAVQQVLQKAAGETE